MKTCNESSATHGAFPESPPLISVVLSFRNEEKVIPEIIRRLRNVLDDECRGDRIGGYELVFVNDASTDRSLYLLHEAAKGHNDMKIINMSRNFGVSECVIAGMRYTGGDAVIYMDTDLQDPPELIPELISKWRDGDRVEVVYTTRRSRAGEHPVKLWLTSLGYKTLRYVSDIDLPINSGDFKLLSRRAVNELLKLQERNPFLRGLVTWVGFKHAQVLYDRDERYGGETKFPIYSRKVINNFLDSALISFSDMPLKISLLMGFFVSFGAFLFLIFVFIHKLMGWALPGWSAITAIILVLGGVQLMTIGVLGLYIGSIFRETKNRPSYIVESTVGFDKHESKEGEGLVE